MTYDEKANNVDNRLKEVSCDICKFVWKCDGKTCKWKNEIEKVLEDEE